MTNARHAEGCNRLFMRWRFLWVILLGCSSSAEPTPPVNAADTFVSSDAAGAVDSVVPTDTSVPTADSGGACNELEQLGAEVTPTAATGFPAMAGGTIADGTYVLTKMHVYEGTPPASAGAQTLVVSGSTAQLVMTRDGMTERQSVTLRVMGSILQFVPLCPPGADDEKPRPFNATATELIIGHDDLVAAWWFTKVL